MSLLLKFQNVIKQQNLFSPKDNLLVAVSGGVDSVVLCELCQQSGYHFIIAHCNFQLRGEESERDEAFVRSLGEKYNVKVLVKKFETENYAEEKKLSLQEAARELRYDWFAELVGIRESGVKSHLLTAHHADDNIETLLMNFCRGTGLNGLTGIPQKHDDSKLRRPLLEFWKEELIQFAKQNNLEFVEDSSNQASKYTRNLFRNEIIPLISKAYPHVKENLQDNIQRFNDIKKFYSISVTAFKKKLYKIKNEEIHIPIKQLLSYQSRALIFEIISEFGFTEKQLDAVIDLADSESGRYIQSPDAPYRIIKFRNWFIISPARSNIADTIIIENGMYSVQYSSGSLQLKVLPKKDCRVPDDNTIACLDLKLIQFPLMLRKWKEGDYFYPLGMKKKKKIARFFIDQKLSKTDKENAWVIEMNKKIIWVVRYRIDERFKLTEQTKDVLKITSSL